MNYKHCTVRVNGFRTANGSFNFQETLLTQRQKLRKWYQFNVGECLTVYTCVCVRMKLLGFVPLKGLWHKQITSVNPDHITMREPVKLVYVGGNFVLIWNDLWASVLVVRRLVSRRSAMCDIWVPLMPHSINTDRLWHAMQRDNRERSLIWVRIY